MVHSSRIGRALSRYGNAVSCKIVALTKELAEHRQSVDIANVLAEMDDRLLEDMGIDHNDIHVIIARVKRERRGAADFYTSNTLL
jgi:uncharacterized protein YjiS (DUF1127 family)